jgi:hypothetical protein
MPTVPCLIKYSVNDFTEEQVTQFRNLMVEDYHELNSKVSKSLSCLQVSLASLEAIAEQMCSGKLKYLRKLRELRGRRYHDRGSTDASIPAKLLQFPRKLCRNMVKFSESRKMSARDGRQLMRSLAC